MSLTEASILWAKEIPLELLRQTKTIEIDKIIAFTITYNPNNPNDFPIIKQSFDNFQYSKTMSNTFRRKKLVKYLSQAPNLCRLLCKSKIESQRKNPENYGKNWVSCPYFLKASLYQFKRVNETFLLQNSFNWESSNLIFVVICQGQKEEYLGEANCLVKERVNIYRQHISQPQYHQLAVEEHFRPCGDGNFRMLAFFKILQENKSLRKPDEDYFINKFKPLLNKRT